jgi:hypothetical protein
MKIREEIARNHFEGNRKENETLIDCNISDSHMVLKDGGRRMQHQTVSTVKVLYQKLGRSGNIQSKNKEFKFGHKYCPFCGEPYEKVYVENQDDIDAIRNTLFAMKKLIEQGELFSQEIDNQMNFALQAVSSLEELKRAVNVAMGGGDKNEQKS